jgi:AraC-like DNA-binding protein
MSDSMLAPGRGPRDDRVRSDALRMYREVVGELGGDPESLLAGVGIPPEALGRPDAVISYRAMIQLLEDSAVELACPDFGLRLASRQGGIAVLGPLAVAMKNSTTVGEAYRYCAAHLQVYSPVVQIQIEEDSPSGRHFMRFEILLARVPQQRQTVENALALTHHAILTLSHGRFGARAVWFMHERLAPAASYRAYFGAPVRFEKPFNAVFFNSRDLAQPIADQNPRVYEQVSGWIDERFPSTPIDLPTRVRVVAGRLLPIGPCNAVEVAARLGMHPRTLQRRLRDEGLTFEEIRDDVRRDAASRYLCQSTLPLTRVSALLGYSEPSVFTRSCRRWFASSPRRLRERWSQPPSRR